MTNQRWRELMQKPELGLTESELKAGWHWCDDMDGLLANSTDPDGDWFCELNKHRRET